MRTSSIKRKTAETDISLILNIDGTGKSEVNSGIGFLDHMLTLFSAHSRFDLTLNCIGDTQVDGHHSAEDIGICLGMALSEALSDKAGINRYASTMLPMDEALILTAIDISGRSCLCYDAQYPTEKIGDFDTELVEEFLQAFVRNCPMSLHVRKLAGSNSHHIAEGIFKSLARSLKSAVAIDPTLGGAIPSTKGVI